MSKLNATADHKALRNFERARNVFAGQAVFFALENRWRKAERYEYMPIYDAG